jgi:SAM-dependent methyltransferase
VTGPLRDANLITTPLGRDACLAVLVQDGCAELNCAGLLRETALELVETLGPDPDEDSISRWLRARGAADDQEARAQARGFLAELRGIGSRPQPSVRSAPESTVEQLDPAAWTRLARAVLASGHRLRFRAQGRSMRPFLPHGSRLEVEARPFGEVRLGEVVLHAAPRAPLVAHRVVGRASGALLTRGDSNARLDRVGEGDYLGVVVARESKGRWRSLSTWRARSLGLASGVSYRWLVAVARLLLLVPLRGTFERPSWLRASLRFSLRLASGACVLGERAAIRARRPLDVLRAALLSAREKDEDRTHLYRRRAIQDFTALEENVRAGLTLLEEVLLARHPLAGRVLVLGCGPGREALALAARGCTVTGLDREPQMLSRARELAAREGLTLTFVEGEAATFDLSGQHFDAIVIFSGLYNMLLPRVRRVHMLECCRRHLVPGGRVLVTFLAAYRWPGRDPGAPGKHLLESVNPEHEQGDLYYLNEAIHVFPRDEAVADEARLAGLETVDSFRDQRAYDRPAGQVRGYVVLRNGLEA